MKNSKKLWVIGIALGVIGLGYKFWPKGNMSGGPVFAVETKTAAHGSLSKHIELLATVYPFHQTVFKAHVKGKVKKIYVTEGEKLKAGTLLAELDNYELERATRHAEEKARLAKMHYDRVLKLYNQGSQSKTNLDKINQEWLRAEIEYESLEQRLKDTKLVIPYDGFCGVFKVREGQNVFEGETIVTCYDTSQFVLSIDIPENLISQMKTGLPISYEGHTGQIKSVQGIIDPDTRMGIARAIVPESWLLTVGQTFWLDIEITHKKNVISVPKSAVILRQDKTFVYTAEEGKAALKPVILGIEGKHDYEIKEGLNKGDQYILRGQENLWPTRPVEIIDFKKAK